ncbi:hypothetical protein EVAR_61813_1 [Eumeta japonica]|uniref:Uncharacterized protein n=1 Tax=Eumeta variegata TaxID=151549 RepID=A0A4C1YXK8_EUMVA|nr:hypothetical protein EVAR_61813_1 [Eumeta japonica]
MSETNKDTESRRVIDIGGRRRGCGRRSFDERGQDRARVRSSGGRPSAASPESSAGECGFLGIGIENGTEVEASREHYLMRSAYEACNFRCSKRADGGRRYRRSRRPPARRGRGPALTRPAASAPAPASGARGARYRTRPSAGAPDTYCSDWTDVTGARSGVRPLPYG